ncbi:MAG: hypothetical protein LBC31_09845 [Treponema sp.]|nr:hypothetical protein [Treponema sp.]
MKNIKKITVLAFLIGMVIVFPAAAQMSKANLQKMYTDYLRQEGYVPSIDKDGDVHFKAEGDNYYIIVNEGDLQFFQVMEQIGLGSTPLQEVLAAASYANRRSKVAKVYISSDGKTATIAVEILLSKPDDFKQLFPRVVTLLKNAQSNFVSQL